ncbi:VOC family protein [Arthrobacter sp. ZBG10]|uniref:VOC family protein n=1 Tax=Arthrobacter sp. ZBG10 TaxID=1676590 RepID=UPI000A51FBB2|nr:VOC family protein [Arthrobacter sp. ZBG10]
MLRVRPFQHTARLLEWQRLLVALGMVPATGNGRTFDAGSGRISLQPALPGLAGRAELGFEVRVLAEFARRTNLDAQGDGRIPAVMSGDGASCGISAPDGFSFLAATANPAVPTVGADPALAVVGLWFTEDPSAAARTLGWIGARPRTGHAAADASAFTAKNGGVILVRQGHGPARSGLGFEYDGDLAALCGRLQAAGFAAALAGQGPDGPGSLLRVPHPDAGPGTGKGTVPGAGGNAAPGTDATAGQGAGESTAGGAVDGTATPAPGELWITRRPPMG